MKTLSALLQKLTSARVLAEVPVLVVRPVTDHSVPTLETPEVATSYPTVRILDGVVTASETSFLQSVTFPVETMSHIPSPVGGAVDSLTRRLRFSLINSPYRGFASYFDYLTRDAPLDRADLELQLVTVPPREMGTHPLHQNRLDFEFSSDGEKNDVFAGRIERVLAVADTIECEARSPLPVVPWKLVPDDGDDPRERGLRLPFPMGKPKAIKCANLKLGAFSSLDARLTIGSTEIELLLAADFPTSGQAMIAAEAVSWSGKTGNRLTGVQRALLSTAQADHVLGTQVLELSDVTLGVSSIPISGVRALFIKNNATNSVVNVSPLLYAVNLDDETTAPGSSGDGIATITIGAANLAALLHTLHAEATVTQQAIYGDQQIETETIEVSGPIADASTFTIPLGGGAEGTWANVTTTPDWTYAEGTGTKEGVNVPFTSSDFAENQMVQIHAVRFGVEVDMTKLDGTEITLGLSVTGMEDVLEGFVDGAVVASEKFEAGDTGVRRFSGTIWIAKDGAHLRDLYDLEMNFVMSDVGGGGIEVELKIEEMFVEYVFADQVVNLTAVRVEPQLKVATVKTNPHVVSGESDRNIYEGDWSFTAADPSQIDPGFPNEQDDAQSSDPGVDAIQIMEGTFTSDPFAAIGGGNNVAIDEAGFGATIFVQIQRAAESNDTYHEVQVLNLVNCNVTSVRQRLTKAAASTTLQTLQTASFTTLPAFRTSDLIGVTIQVLNLYGTADSHPTQNTAHPKVSLSFHIDYDSRFDQVDRLLDAQIQAATGSLTLEFFAVVDGPEAPDGTYSVASGEILEHPSDLIRYWLQEVGGIPAADVDDTTFDAAVTNLVGYQWGLDARNLGGTWEAILLRMGYEARANIVKPSDVKWKMLTANASHSFGAAVATVDSTEKLSEIHKDDSETRSRLTVHFAHDPRFESNDNRSFVAVQTTDPLDAAVIAVEEEFGRNDAEPYFLFCHNGLGAAGVTDWREYLEQELGRGARVFAGRVDHWQSYALEVGDVVDLETTSGTTKARVIESRRDQRAGFVMRFVEVI